MPAATQAISLLLVGTGLCTFAYQASQRDDDGSAASTQPYSGSGGGYHWYHSFLHSGGYSSDDRSASSHFSSTERGGFGIDRPWTRGGTRRARRRLTEPIPCKESPSLRRANWQETVQSQGLAYHTPLDEENQPHPWWDESAYYRFSNAEVDLLESATYALDKMCLDAVEHVITNNLFERLHIPEKFVPLIRKSWDEDEITIYGRFDLCFPGGDAPPKLLEYNADTPTALLEAAVVQWFWLQDVKKAWADVAESQRFDQFNSIHERLIEVWKRLGQGEVPPSPVHLSHVG